MSHTLEQAQTTAAQQPALDRVLLDLTQAYGHVLAADITAVCAVSHYNSAAMDGYAVNATEDFIYGPWQLIGPTPRDGQLTLQPGQASTIVTGGAVPATATSIIRIEHTELAGTELSLHPAHLQTRDVTVGAHIREPGNEAAVGDLVVERDRMMGPAEIAAAAVAGVDRVSCYKKPVVGLVFTGDEVLTQGIPTAGYVRDAFSPYFAKLVERLRHGAQDVPATTLYEERIGDDFEQMLAQLERANNSVDILITTGGTGFSSADYLRRSLDEMAASYLIKDIEMRPGHPTLLARLSSGTYVLGLPGNPLAALVGFAVVGMPLLAALSGLGPLEKFTAPAGLSATNQKPSKHRPNRPSSSTPRLVPARLWEGVVEASSYQGSAMLRGLYGAEFFAVTYPDATKVGEELQLLPLPWTGFSPV